MIQASELRIGNWYSEFGLPKKATGGFIQRLSHIQSLNKNAIDVSGIPLTPEILEKAGLDKLCENEYRKGRLTFQFAKYQDRFIMSVFLDGSLMCILKYLHQLQNLYFALTGEELQIDL